MTQDADFSGAMLMTVNNVFGAIDRRGGGWRVLSAQSSSGSIYNLVSRPHPQGGEETYFVRGESQGGSKIIKLQGFMTDPASGYLRIRGIVDGEAPPDNWYLSGSISRLVLQHASDQVTLEADAVGRLRVMPSECLDFLKGMSEQQFATVGRVLAAAAAPARPVPPTPAVQLNQVVVPR